MTWNFYTAFTVVMVIMALGEAVSKKSKGRIPSLLIVAICFLTGYWTIFPKDILNISMIMSVRTITMFMILLQVGAMFSLNELKQEWRAVIITLLSVAGVIVFAGIAGVLFFDLDTAIVACLLYTSDAADEL